MRPARLSYAFLLVLFSTTVLLSAWLPPSVHAQAAPANLTAESGSAAAAQPFDVKAAVDAYLARVPPDQRARSDAYFEGGYWLLLWDFLSTVVVMWMMLRLRWSVRMRSLAERLVRFKPLLSALYWVQFVVLFAVIVFPLTVYEGYFREHKYGLSNQTFWEWMRDQLVGLALVRCWAPFWWHSCLA